MDGRVVGTDSMPLPFWRNIMGEAARSLDDVSDHLGEVLRRADELLAEWSRFGAEVRVQVDREVAAIGDVVDGAVARAASAGLDRTILDRLRALTAELERLEQRTRAASRAAAERRDSDRRVLWGVVAGIVLANALLVALLLRKPDAAPVAEPIRIESTAAPQLPQAGPAPGNAPPAGSGDTANPAITGFATGVLDAKSAAPSAGSNAPSAGPNTPNAVSNAANAGASVESNPAGARPGAHATPSGAPPLPLSPSAAKQPAEASGQAKTPPSPIALPPKGNPRTHKKLP
jgi:hypothetical protein